MFNRKRRFDRAAREKGVLPDLEHHIDDDRAETSGPYDIADAPEDDVARLDLGALQIPTDAALEVRLEMTESGGLSGISLVKDGSLMQLGVFAAPRIGGIWDDVRGDIAAEITKNAGTANEEDGEFGTELNSVVLDKNGAQESRFIGVDGPRWFLRALIAGPAADDAEAAEVFRAVLRNVVVSRGTEPKPVREPLTLTLPADIAAAAQAEREALGKAES